MATRLRRFPRVRGALPLADYFRFDAQAASEVPAYHHGSAAGRLRESRAAFSLPRDRASSPLRRMSWPVMRSRRELDELRGEVRQLEYIQHSVLQTVDRLCEVTSIMLGKSPDDGQAPWPDGPVAAARDESLAEQVRSCVELLATHEAKFGALCQVLAEIAEIAGVPEAGETTKPNLQLVPKP
ncbi:MAG: hypothetical protein ACLQFR_07520 [Streptosporangiaceae bacterium]